MNGDADKEMIDFDEFRRQVGAAEPSVRAALKALRIEAVPLLSDRRKLRYPTSEVERVREWILQNLRSH